MSHTLTLYVVDEEKLPSKLEGLSDQEKYDRLVAAVEAEGARWALVELPIDDLADALYAIDAEIGGTEFLPVFAFNNSPHNVLGDYGNCPHFGYFNPTQAADLHACLLELPAEVIDGLVNTTDEALEEVFSAFQSAAEEAARRGYALAVVH